MIPLSRPLIGEGELGAVDRVLRSGRLVAGPDPSGDPERVVLSGEVYSDLEQMLRIGVDAVGARGPHLAATSLS